MLNFKGRNNLSGDGAGQAFEEASEKLHSNLAFFGVAPGEPSSEE